ncbi:hypothetical protein QQF64_034908 [Cirrhinus molitorella]|uniref:Uncharacterized protein n=1 Tax=Cirrhinus molitorella TaxID=172907 RepID=A0ABR3NE89_9TELE
MHQAVCSMFDSDTRVCQLQATCTVILTLEHHYALITHLQTECRSESMRSSHMKAAPLSRDRNLCTLVLRSAEVDSLMQLLSPPSFCQFDQNLGLK